MTQATMASLKFDTIVINCHYSLALMSSSRFSPDSSNQSHPLILRVHQNMNDSLSEPRVASKTFEMADVKRNKSLKILFVMHYL